MKIEFGDIIKEIKDIEIGEVFCLEESNNPLMRVAVSKPEDGEPSDEIYHLDLETGVLFKEYDRYLNDKCIVKNKAKVVL